MFVTLSFGIAPALADDVPESGSTSVCAQIAQQAVENADGVVLEGTEAVSFACIGDQVVATVDAGTDSAQRVENDVQYADEVPSDAPSSSEEEPLIVPFTAAASASNFCATGGYDRRIKSEREDFIWGCTNYGQYDPKTGRLLWERFIQWEWTMYPGWNSAQNKLRTIPSTGAPIMSGYFSSWKQRGVLPPENIAVSAFTNKGNTTTQGWSVDGLNTGGQFSVWMGDVSIRDDQKGFNEYFGGSIASHRFTCDTSKKRCYYPGGKEAPL